MIRRLPPAALLIGVVVSACSIAAAPMPSSQKPTAVQAPEQPSVSTGGKNEAPAAILDKVRADAATRAGVGAAAVKLVSSEAVMWPNGALGCGKPGEMVTQAIVPGYRIELEANGQRYTYHTSERGRFRLCTGIARGRLPRETDK
jgi:hypothetical protein